LNAASVRVADQDFEGRPRTLVQKMRQRLCFILQSWPVSPSSSVLPGGDSPSLTAVPTAGVENVRVQSTRSASKYLSLEPMMSPTRPDTVHAIGRVRVVHPSDVKALTLVGEGFFLLTFHHVYVVCARECVDKHGD
jgi:hypothetical protein